MDKIDKEKLTVGTMISIYCRGQHHSVLRGQLCADCSELLDYAMERLNRCPKRNTKRSCRKCEIHCYSPARRNQIRSVMRYAGSRMLLVSPVAALRHLLE